MVSVKVAVDNGMEDNKRLVMNLRHLLPEEYWRLYKKNVVNITPKKSSALRRSIRHQILGNQLIIDWRAKYAAAQNAGGHRVGRRRVVNIDGRFVTLKPDYYPYKNYTSTPGAGFREKAASATQAQFMAEFYKNHPEYR